MSIHHNHIELIGRLHGELKTVTNKHGDRLFEGLFAVNRMSGTVDLLPITIPQHIVGGDVQKTMQAAGLHLRLGGEIISFNKETADGKSRHHTVMHVKEITEESSDTDDNRVELVGVICREPRYRETPFGREICDFMVAINRSCGRTAYIPAICWGRTALKVSALDVGTTVSLKGRFQSRQYNKVLENGENETRVTHEVSCKRVDIVKQEEAAE